MRHYFDIDRVIAAGKKTMLHRIIIIISSKYDRISYKLLIPASPPCGVSTPYYELSEEKHSLYPHQSSTTWIVDKKREVQMRMTGV